MLILISLSISGCETKVVPVYIDTFCLSPNIPIRPSVDDRLTRGSKEQIVGLGEEWERKCVTPTTPSGDAVGAPTQ